LYYYGCKSDGYYAIYFITINDTALLGFVFFLVHGADNYICVTPAAAAAVCLPHNRAS
jgi:hypothetical protein